MKLYLFLITFNLLIGGCTHPNLKTQPNIKITENLSGSQYGDIYFSAQPTEADFLKLKNNGFVAVINLREKKEQDYLESWEKDLVNQQGIAYYNIPFSMKSDMNNDYIDSVTTKVKKHMKDGKVLIHCSSGNRVGIWVGAHFMKDHGYSKDEAMKVAKDAGLNQPNAEKKLQLYLDSH